MVGEIRRKLAKKSMAPFTNRFLFFIICPDATNWPFSSLFDEKAHGFGVIGRLRK
jgi:hypothetical protein